MRKTKKPNRRRIAPNLEAEAKIFPDHHTLYWANDYDRYEEQKQSYLETGIWIDEETDEQRLMTFWPLIECLLKVQDIPDEELTPESEAILDQEFMRLVSSVRTFELIDQIQEIHNVYLTLKRSLDFPTKTSREIDLVLKRSRKNGIQRNLISDDEKVFLRSLVFDAKHFTDEKQSTNRLKVAEAYLMIQSEIDKFGYITDLARKILKELKSLRAGIRRPRTYSQVALIMMLAEFFENENEFGAKASIQTDKAQIPEKEYLDFPDYDEKGDMLPWTQSYESQFYDFLISYECVFDEIEFKMSNAESLLKKRSKLELRNVLELFGLRKSEPEFEKIILLLDSVKP